MRQPSSKDALYAWYESALVGRAQMYEDDPQCGYYFTRFVRNGPKIPIEIRCEQVTDALTGELTEPETLVALVGPRAERRSAVRIWTRCRPISCEEFRELMSEGRSSDRLEATHAPVSFTDMMQRP